MVILVNSVTRFVMDGPRIVSGILSDKHDNVNRKDAGDAEFAT
jgi:ribosomal protein L11 methylase PrmA